LLQIDTLSEGNGDLRSFNNDSPVAANLPNSHAQANGPGPIESNIFYAQARDATESEQQDSDDDRMQNDGDPPIKRSFTIYKGTANDLQSQSKDSSSDGDGLEADMSLQSSSHAGTPSSK
jgi:hypothetical protein